VAAAGTGSAKPKPVALTGDPDAPQGPPPPVTLSGGGLTSPSQGDANPAGRELTVPPWWISWILAMLYGSTAP
jgi:hypothetical protein